MISRIISTEDNQPPRSQATQNWGFYGRKKQLQSLKEFVEKETGFDVLAIRGRRQVGKTELVQTFFDQRRFEGDSQVFLFCKLLRRDQTREDFFKRLTKVVRSTKPELIEGFEFAPDGDEFEFGDLVEHLLRQGCVVALDEFQRIRSTEGTVESEFQFIIDQLRRESDRRVKSLGRLIVLGSEQQRLAEMFKHPAAPMYGRVHDMLHLKPWRFAEFREMAVEQGWDQNPGRLLTLWTCYNGLPGHWRRFWGNDHLSDFSRILDDAEWTRKFLEMEEQFRSAPGGEFHSQMEVELRASDLALVRWLASRPSGYNIKQDLRQRAHRGPLKKIKATLQNELLDESLSDAEVTEKVEDAIRYRLSGDHLGLLKKKIYFDDPTDEKWHVCDNFARFQLQVLEQIQIAAEKDPTVITPENVNRRRRRLMASLEGYGLEHLTAEFFRDMVVRGSTVFPAGNYEHTAVFLNFQTKFPTEVEFDVFVVTHPAAANNRQGHLWLLSVKRQPSLHNVQNDVEALDRFFDPVDSSHIKGLFARVDPLSYRRHYVFVSPKMSVPARSRCHEYASNYGQRLSTVSRIDHWYVMTIEEMMSGSGPQPLELAAKSDRI
ncbi:MAG: AAA family ATPase [Aestuariivita sp.]|nr:AAA family ATPase [Aestuariivita sp.]MCY4203997.1 AAA family ATPase [Aestuariivita sp.]